MTRRFSAFISSAALVCSALATLSADESQFLSRARQITFEGKSGEGYFSPDGKSLVFQSVREPGNPFYQIYLLSLETGDIHRVSPGYGKTTCAFFQPGTDRLLFASTHHDPDARQKQEDELAFLASGNTRRYSWDYDPAMEIYSATRKGSDLRRLTDAPGYDAEGAYSPDGKQIVFSSIRDAYPLDQLPSAEQKRYETDPAYFAEIYTMDADGQNQRRLTTTHGYDGGPFFNADGTRIIWRRFEESGLIANVYSMKTDGSDVRRITNFDSMSWAPYPHPSGQYIIFTSNKHGFENFELFLVDTLDEKEPVRITFTDGFDGLPVFSPDGKKLCWTSNRTSDKQSQLFLADWNHAAALSALNLSATGQTAPGASSNSPAAAGSLSPEIRAADARLLVTELASDKYEGRLTGTEGIQKAAQYIAGQLQALGVKPPPGSTYYQPFEFSAGVDVLTNSTTLVIENEGSQPEEFQVNRDFRPLAFSSSGSATGELVFAGYGLSVPGKLGEGYDSYSGLNVSNKIVLVLRYVPEAVEPKRRQELNRYAALRYKAMIAREKGAKAILIVTGPNSPNAGELIGLTSDGSLSGSDILAGTISSNVASALLTPYGRNLADLQTALDTENPHVEMGLALTNTIVRLQFQLEHQTKKDRNVLGVIPPSNGSGEYIMIGAHYDHLGHGDSSHSLDWPVGQIHNGADDNASGVAAVLELAGYFADLKKSGTNLNRGLIFAFWSGEELGLLGSSRFVENSPIPLTDIAAYLNFDMVGRLTENKLTLQGLGSSPIWRKLIEKRNVAAAFDLSIQDDPYLPTDVTAIYPKNIPVLAFFTGSHDDYHRPSDDAEKVNYEGLERITRFARAITTDLVNAETRPEYVKVESSNEGGQRDSLRAYLGTIPDYSTEVKGVKLSGVRPGSPADKGGLKGDDVITEFAGQSIANIYDYTYALDAAKIGQPVKVKVEREGKEVELEVTPEARK